MTGVLRGFLASMFRFWTAHGIKWGRDFPPSKYLEEKREFKTNLELITM